MAFCVQLLSSTLDKGHKLGALALPDSKVPFPLLRLGTAHHKGYTGTDA